MSAGDHVNSRKKRKFVGEEEKKNFYLNEYNYQLRATIVF